MLKSYSGPNVATGHASVIFSQEAQVRAVASLPIYRTEWILKCR